MEESYERRQSTSDKAEAAHMLAAVTSAQLISHAAEDQRQFASIANTMENLSNEVKAISKWIWIATGAMLAVKEALDLLIHK